MKYESITEESVAALLKCFYAKIRRDPVLAPIYTEALGEYWETHIARMQEFWCSALRVKRQYRRDMLAAHQKIGTLKPSLFPRWLARFREAVAECFAQAPAEAINDRALKTARNLETALFKGRNNAAERTHPSTLTDRHGEHAWQQAATRAIAGKNGGPDERPRNRAGQACWHDRHERRPDHPPVLAGLWFGRKEWR